MFPAAGALFPICSNVAAERTVWFAPVILNAVEFAFRFKRAVWSVSYSLIPTSCLWVLLVVSVTTNKSVLAVAPVPFRGVTVTYNGTGATANTDLLVVTDTTNNTQRQDVGIRLYDTDQTALLNLNANSTAFNITGANHTVRSAATFEQIGNNAPAAGNFQGNVNLDINYP